MRCVHAFLVSVLVGLTVVGVASATLVQRLHPPGSQRMGTTDIAFSPNGRWLVGVGFQSIAQGMFVRSVNEATGALTAIRRRPFLGEWWPSPFAFSPDGRFLAGPNGRGILMISMNPRTGGIRRRSRYADSSASAVEFSPNGRFLAVGGYRTLSMLAVNPRTGAMRYVSRWVDPQHSSDPALGQILRVAFNRRGDLLAVQVSNEDVTVLSVGRHGTLRLWAQVPAHISAHALALAFSPIGRFLAIAGGGAGGNGILMLRVKQRIGTLRRVPGRLFSNPWNAYMAFSPNGKLLAFADGAGVDLGVASVNERTGKLRHLPGSPFRVGPGRYVTSLAFNPNGHLLALGTQTDFDPGHAQIEMFSVRY